MGGWLALHPLQSWLAFMGVSGWSRLRSGQTENPRGGVRTCYLPHKVLPCGRASRLQLATVPSGSRHRALGQGGGRGHTKWPHGVGLPRCPSAVPRAPAVTPSGGTAWVPAVRWCSGPGTQLACCVSCPVSHREIQQEEGRERGYSKGRAGPAEKVPYLEG